MFPDNNNFLGAKFNNVKFYEGKMYDCVFREAEFKKSCEFTGSVIKDCIFSGSIHNNTIFSCTKILFSRLMGCCYSSSRFFKVILQKCNFRGTKFRYCLIGFSNLWSSEFDSCEFINCYLNHLKFGGSNLNKAIFRNCNISNIDFSGADLANVKFIKCRFNENVNFSKSHNYEKVLFEKCSGL